MSTWKEGEMEQGENGGRKGEHEQERSKRPEDHASSIQEFTGGTANRKWTSEAHGDNADTQKKRKNAVTQMLASCIQQIPGQSGLQSKSPC